MWTMLAGVPGKLKALLDRLPADRAARIDNLDATILSRAPASTAVSNTVLTDTLIGRLNANVLQYGVVKSVQHAVIALATPGSNGSQSATATITAVATGKSFVLHCGAAAGSSVSFDTTDKLSQMSARVTLTNATTVTATRFGRTTSPPIDVAVTVVEFY